MIVTLSALVTLVALIGSYIATNDLAVDANLAMSAGRFDESTAKFANA